MSPLHPLLCFLLFIVPVVYSVLDRNFLETNDWWIWVQLDDKHESMKYNGLFVDNVGARYNDATHTLSYQGRVPYTGLTISIVLPLKLSTKLSGWRIKMFEKQLTSPPVDAIDNCRVILDGGSNGRQETQATVWLRVFDPATANRILYVGEPAKLETIPSVHYHIFSALDRATNTRDSSHHKFKLSDVSHFNPHYVFTYVTVYNERDNNGSMKLLYTKYQETELHEGIVLFGSGPASTTFSIRAYQNIRYLPRHIKNLQLHYNIIMLWEDLEEYKETFRNWGRIRVPPTGLVVDPLELIPPHKNEYEEDPPTQQIPLPQGVKWTQTSVSPDVVKTGLGIHVYMDTNGNTLEIYNSKHGSTEHGTSIQNRLLSKTETRIHETADPFASLGGVKSQFDYVFVELDMFRGNRAHLTRTTDLMTTLRTAINSPPGLTKVVLADMPNATHYMDSLLFLPYGSNLKLYPDITINQQSAPVVHWWFYFTLFAQVRNAWMAYCINYFASQVTGKKMWITVGAAHAPVGFGTHFRHRHVEDHSLWENSLPAILKNGPKMPLPYIIRQNDQTSELYIKFNFDPQPVMETDLQRTYLPASQVNTFYPPQQQAHQMVYNKYDDNQDLDKEVKYHKLSKQNLGYYQYYDPINYNYNAFAYMMAFILGVVLTAICCCSKILAIGGCYSVAKFVDENKLQQ